MGESIALHSVFGSFCAPECCLFHGKHCKLQRCRVIEAVVFGSLLSSRPPVIKNLVRSASWASDPLENIENTAPGGPREPNSSKTQRFFTNRRLPKNGTEINRIHNSLVQYGFGGTTCLTNPAKTSCWATFSKTMSSSQTSIRQGNH